MPKININYIQINAKLNIIRNLCDIMKIKHIMLITLMLIAVLSIGAASAADDITINETLDQSAPDADTNIIATAMMTIMMMKTTTMKIMTTPRIIL